MISPSKIDAVSQPQPIITRQIWKITFLSIFLQFVIGILAFLSAFFFLVFRGNSYYEALGISIIIDPFAFLAVNLFWYLSTKYIDIYSKYNHPDLLTQEEFKEVCKDFKDANKSLKLAKEDFHNAITEEDITTAENNMVDSFLTQEFCRKILNQQHSLRIRCHFKIIYGLPSTVQYDEEQQLNQPEPSDLKIEEVSSNAPMKNELMDASITV